MTRPVIRISPKAMRFLRENNITDITFRIAEFDVPNTMGIIKEIEPVYEAPADARAFRYCQVDEFFIFVARDIRMDAKMTIATEGIWRKKLCLKGARPPFFNFLY